MGARRLSYDVNSQCNVKGCFDRPRSKELCSKHYRAMMKHGDPLLYRPPVCNNNFQQIYDLLIRDPFITGSDIEAVTGITKSSRDSAFESKGIRLRELRRDIVNDIVRERDEYLKKYGPLR